MKNLKIKFIDTSLSKELKNILRPQRQSELASGFDLVAAEEAVILPGERKLIGTGISIELSPGFEGQVRSRSGLALKHGISVLNSPGTIDADYRGEIKVILLNSGNEAFSVSFGMRIAQLVIAKVELLSLIECEEMDETSRGALGFGSTGLV